MRRGICTAVRLEEVQNIPLKCIGHVIQKSRKHRVEDEDAGFALRGDEEAKQSLVALTVMVQVDVSHTACNVNHTVKQLTH